LTTIDWLIENPRPIFKKRDLVFAFIEASSLIGLGKLFLIEGLLRSNPILKRAAVLLYDCIPLTCFAIK
jgi:hypothetical protein